MKKIVYISSYSNRTHHEVFNNLLLQSLLKKYDVRVFSTIASFEQIRKSIDNQQFTYVKLPSLQGVGGVTNFVRYLLGAIYDIFILLFSKGNQILVYNFSNPFALLALNWLNSFFKRKVLIFCHAEMELLVNKNGGFLARLLSFCVRNFFLKKRKLHISFCVLGDSILNNLKPIIGDKTSRFMSIDHPYAFSVQKQQKVQKPKNEIRLGTIGTLSNFKGLNSYLSLIQEVTKINNSPLKFSVIGSVIEKEREFEALGVDVKGKGELLDREMFEKCIEELDYILFFYSKDTYKLAASGAIFDAVKWEKPIISLKNDYFSYLFQKFGSVGFLCEDIKQMASIISEIGQENVNYDFDKYKKSLSVESFDTQLFTKLEDELLCY